MNLSGSDNATRCATVLARTDKGSPTNSPLFIIPTQAPHAAIPVFAQAEKDTIAGWFNAEP